MTDVAPPRDGPPLARRLTTEGWTVRTTTGDGTVPATEADDDNVRGNGTVPNLVVQVPCLSWRLTAVHPDGRALVIVWVRRLDPLPSGKPRGWTADPKKRGISWRAPRPDEHGPQPLPWADVKTYTAPATRTETAA